jgi:SAM-dependent methyltransferase
VALHFDHSLTYRVRSLRNLPHRMRLRAIEREVRRLDLGGGTYADFGCSNGFVTERIRRLTGAARAWGFDHLEEHLEIGRAQYPAIEFSLLDLNQATSTPTRFDFVTCLETLEHVGDLETAIDNLLAATKPGGTALITVPVEVGLRGVAKFAAKMAYGYTLSELPRARALWRRYVIALLTGRRMSQFRDRRRGWGTHFGFDYRDLDDALRRNGVQFRAWNGGTTRFYVIQAPSGLRIHNRAALPGAQ